MADEISVQCSLTLANGTLQYTNRPTTFRATQTTKNGPTPGTVSVATSGSTISLASLTTPGFVVMTNLDSANYVSYGLYISSTYYPLGELLAGETTILRFARDILTANTAAAVFRMTANTSAVRVKIEAFDK